MSAGWSCSNFAAATGPGGTAATGQTFAAASMPSRQRFYVELMPGETNCVSWKKLLKDAQIPCHPQPIQAPPGTHPALEARIAPEVSPPNDPLLVPNNRLSSVIEKIERLYRGGSSDDEQEIGDDDKYDTRDSFINDEDLDDYFSVETAILKHKGFFVNRGKPEIEPPVPPGDAVPQKRKRLDVKKSSSGRMEGLSKKVKSGVKLKDVARKVSSTSNSDYNHQTVHEEMMSCKGIFSDPSAKNNLVNGESHKMASPHYKGTSRIEDESKRDMQTGVIQSLQVKPVSLSKPNQSIEKVDAVRRVSILEENGTKEKLKAPKEELKDTAGAASKKLVFSAAKDVSPGRAKSTPLERAVSDLEKGMAQSCPPSLVAREAEQGKRNRLPLDIKQKLAKVARLAAKQGGITDELIERLMGILGHMMQVKTLKRNLKQMIEMGVSAMQEREGKLQNIKREVTEMINDRLFSLKVQEAEQREVVPNDAQPMGHSPEKANSEGRYHWDHAIEDKICDLYEQYIEGMDENRGPHTRKLYAELAELWPDGRMDNFGVKHAVHRAKERKRKQVKARKSAETKKRMRSIGKHKVEDLDLERVSIIESSELSMYDKSRTSSIDNAPGINGNPGHEMPEWNEENKKLLSTRKQGRIDKKRNKTESSSPCINLSTEKGLMDPSFSSKGGLNLQGILASSSAQWLALASPT